jgi:hypothetical protein
VLEPDDRPAADPEMMLQVEMGEWPGSEEREKLIYAEE